MDVDGVTDLLVRSAAEAPQPPAWDPLLSRAIRRRRRGRFASAVAVPVAVIVAITIAVTSFDRSPDLSLSPSGPPPPSVPVVKLAGNATSIGVVFGETWTNTSREAVLVKSPATLTSDLKRVGLAGQHGMNPAPGYLFEITGHFTCENCYSTERVNGVMRHIGPLHPVALFGWMSKSGGHSQFFGGTTSTFDLNQLGPAFTIPADSNTPTTVPIRLYQPFARRHHRGLPGRVSITDQHGATVATVDVPPTGRTSVKLNPGQYYTFTGSQADGQACAAASRGDTGSDRIPVVNGFSLTAYVPCDG